MSTTPSNLDGMTREQLLAKIAEMEKAQAAERTAKLSLKIADKGGISLYGLGRFPVTLYFEQWLRLLDFGETIRGFITANRSKLKTKAEAKDSQ